MLSYAGGRKTARRNAIAVIRTDPIDIPPSLVMIEKREGGKFQLEV